MNLFVRNHLFIQLDIREFWRGFRTTIGTIIKVFSIENGIFNTKQQFSIKLYILINTYRVNAIEWKALFVDLQIVLWCLTR